MKNKLIKRLSIGFISAFMLFSSLTVAKAEEPTQPTDETAVEVLEEEPQETVVEESKETTSEEVLKDEKALEEAQPEAEPQAQEEVAQEEAKEEAKEEVKEEPSEAPAEAPAEEKETEAEKPVEEKKEEAPEDPAKEPTEEELPKEEAEEVVEEALDEENKEAEEEANKISYEFSVDEYTVVLSAEDGVLPEKEKIQVVKNSFANNLLTLEINGIYDIEPNGNVEVIIKGDNIPSFNGGTLTGWYKNDSFSENIDFEVNDNELKFNTLYFGGFAFTAPMRRMMLKAAPRLMGASQVQPVTEEFVKQNSKLQITDVKSYNWVMTEGNGWGDGPRFTSTETKKYDNIGTYKDPETGVTKPIGVKVTGVSSGVQSVLGKTFGHGFMVGEDGNWGTLDISLEYYYMDDPNTIIELKNAYVTIGSLADPRHQYSQEFAANSGNPGATIYVSQDSDLVTREIDGLTFVGGCSSSDFRDDPTDPAHYSMSVAAFPITGPKTTLRVVGQRFWFNIDTYAFGIENTPNNLTIHYVEKGNHSNVLAPQHGPQELYEGDAYSVKSPDVANWHLVNSGDATKSGTMGTEDIELWVEYERDPRLIIHYLEQGTDKILATQYGPTYYKPGSKYNVPSPSVDGYYIVDDSQTTMSGTINKDEEFTVYYAPYYKITTEVVNGEISPDITKIKAGETKQVNYAPNPAHILESIEIDGRELSNPLDYLNNYKFENIQADHHIKVVYIPMTPPVKTVKNEYGEDMQGQFASRREKLYYEIEFENPSALEREYTITDELNENLKFVSADNNGQHKDGVITWEKIKLAPGAKGKVSFVAETTKNNVKIPNTAGQSDPGDPKAKIDSNEVYSFVPKPPVKDVKNDDGISIDGELVGNGDTLHYEVTVENNADTEKLFTVTDAIPTNTELVEIYDDGINRAGIITWRFELEAGATKTVKFDVKAVGEKVRIDNQAVEYVDDAVVESNMVTNWTTPDPVKAVKNLEGIDINGQYVNIGSEMMYEITVENSATEEKIFTVTDELPALTQFVEASDEGEFENGVVTWEFNMQPGETKVLSIKVKVLADGINRVLTNEAVQTVDHLNLVTEPVENYIPTEGPEGHTKEVLNAQGEDIHTFMVEVEENLYYQLIIDNVAKETKHFIVRDPMPEGVEFVKVEDDGRFENNEVIWEFDLEGETAKTLHFVVKATEYLAHIDNSAYVTVDDAKEERTNTTKNTTPEPPVIGSYVTVHKSSDPISGSIVERGQTITYYLEAINTGATKSGKTIIEDRIPYGATYVEGSASDGGKFDGSKVVFEVSGLEPQASKKVSFKVTVNEDVDDVIKNFATFSTDGEEPKTTEITVHGTEDMEIPASLQLIKSNNPIGKVQKDDIIEYTLAVKNIGGSVSKDTVITDSIPVGSQYVAVKDGGTFNQAKSRVEWYIGDLQPQEEVKVRFQVRVIVNSKTTIENQALFGNDIPKEELPSTDPENKSNIVVNPVEPMDDPNVNGSLVTVHKSSDPISGTKVKVGQTITYKLTAINTGAQKSGKTTITDAIPVGTTYVDGSASKGGTFKDGKVIFVTEGLMPEEQREFTFKVKVEDAPARLIRNHATYTTDDEGTHKTEETIHPLGDIEAPASLQAIKRADKQGVVMVGDELTYTIAIKNIGGTKAKDVVITDAIPAGTEYVSVADGGSYNSSRNRVEWYVGDLAVQEEKEVSFKVKVTGARKNILNQAEFDMDIPKSELPSKDLDNSTNIVEHILEEPFVPTPVKGDLVTVYKSANPVTGSKVKPGDTITYTLTAKNTGTSTSGKTTIEDELNSHLEFVSAENGGTFKDGKVHFTIESIPAGGEKSVSFKVKVKDNVIRAIIPNHALYQSDNDKNPGPKPTNEVVHGVGDVELPPVLELRKTADKSGIVATGEDVVYTLRLVNNGGLSKDTVITDRIPEGTELVSIANGGKYNATKNRAEWYLGDVRPGESVEVKFTVRVTATKGVILNQALFDNDIPEADLPNREPENTSNIVELPLREEIIVSGDLVTVHKSANPASGSRVKAGQEITYTLTARNTGTEKSGTTVITDKLDSNVEYVANSGGKFENGVVTFSVNGIEPGKEQSVSFKVRVKDGVTDALIANHAIYQTNTDKNPGPKKTNEVVHGVGDKVAIPAVLEMEKKVDKTSAKQGEELTYTLTIKNNGGMKSENTVITDNIPEGATFVSAGNNGKYNSGRNRVEWYIGDLNAGASATVTFKVKVSASSGAVFNQARFGNNVPQDQLSNVELPHTSNIVKTVINGAQKEATPNTGDNFNACLYGGIAVIALALAALLIYKLRKSPVKK